VQHINQRCSKFQIPSTTVETYVLPVPAWNTIETSGDHHHDNIIHTNNHNDNTNRITSYLLKSRNKRRLADVLMIDALAYEFLLKMAIRDWVFFDGVWRDRGKCEAELLCDYTEIEPR
jgi:hypothetical protein